MLAQIHLSPFYNGFRLKNETGETMTLNGRLLLYEIDGMLEAARDGRVVIERRAGQVTLSFEADAAGDVPAAD